MSAKSWALEKAVELTNSALQASTREAGGYVITHGEATAQFLETVYNKLVELREPQD